MVYPAKTIEDQAREVFDLLIINGLAAEALAFLLEGVCQTLRNPSRLTPEERQLAQQLLRAIAKMYGLQE